MASDAGLAAQDERAGHESRLESSAETIEELPSHRWWALAVIAIAQLMVVLDGTGNIVTDGKLVDEKRVNANNLSGSSIAGGVTHEVVKGDMIIIPASTPHQVIPTGGAPIVIMTMHVTYPAAGWPPAN